MCFKRITGPEKTITGVAGGREYQIYGGSIEIEKKDIHFIGFLANVDNSILRLKLQNGFEIKKLTQQETMPFLRKIDFYQGVDTGFQVRGFPQDGSSSGLCCITKQSVAKFEGTSQGGVIGKVAKVKKFVRMLKDKIRLLRLYKEGNIGLWFSFFYYMKDTEPSVISIHSEESVVDKTKFHLEDSEISGAQFFIENHRIPFKERSLQLAFESFELSYESHSAALSFLSLMIAMEVMLNRGKDELRYRISRNAAVLLGETKEKSEQIFKDVRDLYDKRSKIVHSGDRKAINQEDVLKLRSYVRESIKEISRIDKDKDDLLDTLNFCGFGQRTWCE